MKLLKRINGLLEIDPEMGKIWLNSTSGCILRINNIKFENESDKFSFIDIKDGKAIISSDTYNDYDTDFETFLNGFIDTILLSRGDINPEDVKKIYENCKKNLENQISIFKGEKNGNIE